MRGQPVTFSLNLAGRANQYDLWPGFPRVAQPGDELVLVLDDSDDTHPALRRLASHFREIRPGSAVELRARRGVVARRRLWILVDWAGSWPTAPSPSG